MRNELTQLIAWAEQYPSVAEYKNISVKQILPILKDFELRLGHLEYCKDRESDLNLERNE